MTAVSLVLQADEGEQCLPCPARWPLTSRAAGGEVWVGGVALGGVAARLGTPARVVDEADVRWRLHEYRRTFAAAGIDMAYDTSAFLCEAMAAWLTEEGWSLAASSAADAGFARAAGFPAARTLLHLGDLDDAELRTAFAYGVGRVVVAPGEDPGRLAGLAGLPQSVLARLPGRAAGGGRRAEYDAAGAAATVRRLAGRPEIDLRGVYVPVIGQAARAHGYAAAVRAGVELMAAVRDEHGVVLTELQLADGGCLVCSPGDAGFRLAGFAGSVADALRRACARSGLPVPRLTVELGRPVVAHAALTLCEVRAVERGAGHRARVTVDAAARPDVSGVPEAGPGADTPVARVIGRAAAAPTTRMALAGATARGSRLISGDVHLPVDLRAGELLALPVVSCTADTALAPVGAGAERVAGVRSGGTRLLVPAAADRLYLRTPVLG